MANQILPRFVVSLFMDHDGTEFFGSTGDYSCDMIDGENREQIAATLIKKGIQHRFSQCTNVHGMYQLIYKNADARKVQTVLKKFPMEEVEESHTWRHTQYVANCC